LETSVLLGEPPRTQYDLNFSLFGIPVRVHPWFWIVTLLLGSRSDDAGMVITWVCAVFISILLHELGHAMVMRAYGFRPWITLYGLGGQTAYNIDYSSRSNRGSGPLGQILICLAGPGAGFLLAVVLTLAIAAAGYGDNILFVGPGKLQPVILGLFSPRVAILLNDVLYICVFWGLINLLPVYPLDGGQITREILMLFNPRDGIRQSLILSIFVAGLMAITGLVQWHSYFTALFFGYLAYSSYAALEAYSRRGPW
jgi:stage IV sporulation protein FB